MRLVLTIPPLGRHAEPQWIPLRGEGIDVGGASDCDAIVEHASVGTARVRIERQGEHWVVIDREGRGVCSVGGVPLRAREPRIVRPPHGLRLGDVELALAFDPLDSQDGDGSTREVALRAAAFVAEVAPSRPRVRVVEGPRIGDTLDLAHAGPYRVGRGKGCDLFLDAEEASREHFTIECQGERVVVRDLGSPRGTYLGRSRLEPNRGAVWDPSRMLRAADAVFSLEVASQGSPERLLAPLERIREEAVPHVDVVGADVAAPVAAEAVEVLGGPASSAEPVGPASAPPAGRQGEVARPAQGRPPRDPTFVIVLLAVVIGLVGVGVLVALFLA
jgi:hypothetical protein